MLSIRNTTLKDAVYMAPATSAGGRRSDVRYEEPFTRPQNSALLGDSAEMPNKMCSNCTTYNLKCTHDIPRHASKVLDSSFVYVLVLTDIISI
ncbi:Gypsy retrotransposon integrase-like protein 1 [Leucoagaricus gongylophorus]